MKGAIFLALEQMIEEKHGLNVWHQLLDHAKEDGIYTSTMTYDDERLYSLVGAVCDIFDLEANDVLRGFGEYLFAVLHQSAPVFADSKSDFFAFIDSLGGVIHMEVVKLDEEARPPHIEVSNVTESSADFRYTSDRKLCHLAEGLLKGAANHYGISVNMTHSECMHKGAEHCDIRIEKIG